MQKTANYQLNQWDAGDAIKRTDFNGDNAKIDAAIKAVEQKALTAVSEAKATAANNVAAAKQEAASALAAYKSSNDTAVAALEARPYFGSWVGDGTASRVIQLPFAPRLLMVLGYLYTSSTSQQAVIILHTQDCGYRIASSGTSFSSQEAGGILDGNLFRLGSNAAYHNYSGKTTYYIALK